MRTSEGKLACENIEEGDEMSGGDRRRNRTGEARAAAPATETEGAREESEPRELVLAGN